MPYGKTTFTSGSAPAVDSGFLNTLQDAVIEAQRGPYVTALPTTGPGGGALVDGQECYLKPDPTNATGNAKVAWHMKYDATSGKWIYVGGAPLIRKIDADEAFATDGGYNNATTVGPSLTIPFAGDYTYRLGANMYKSAQTGPWVVALSVNNAAPASPHMGQEQSSGTGVGITVFWENDITFAAGQVGQSIKLLYQGPNLGGSGQTRWRRLALQPLALG